MSIFYKLGRLTFKAEKGVVKAVANPLKEMARGYRNTKDKEINGNLGYKSVAEEVMEGGRDNPLDYEDGDLNKPIIEKYRELKKAKEEVQLELDI